MGKKGMGKGRREGNAESEDRWVGVKGFSWRGLVLERLSVF